jgi:hypothetical protein
VVEIPTAVLLWPNSVSVTRYSTSDPLAIVYVPGRFVAAADDGLAAATAVRAVAVGVDAPSESDAGGGPSMKWMKTKGPTTVTPRTTAMAVASHSLQ